MRGPAPTACANAPTYAHLAALLEASPHGPTFAELAQRLRAPARGAPPATVRRGRGGLRIGSLFAGIGGLELGLEWAGIGTVAWQVEVDAFCRRVLARHWPDADRSVTNVEAASASNLAPVDVICGGFPCTDVSVAGHGAGLAGAGSGLWYEFLRVVDECRPFAVVVENVAHGRSRYLCEVRGGLQELGYATTALCISAFETGAPHVRDRCFVVAHADSSPVRQRTERQPGGRARSVRGQGQAQPGHARAARRRLDQPGVGGGAAGAADWLHGPRWPSPRRKPRQAWEPRFAVKPGPFHAERLRAIGNAVAPLVSRAVGLWMIEEGIVRRAADRETRGEANA